MKKLLLEGPVGHMWHPFDLDQVQTGKDLLSIFQDEVVEYINEFTPSIKIDGINGPIRLIVNDAGEKEFAIDRLSTAPLDLRGVTIDRLKERFEKAVLQALDTDEEIKLPLHKLVAMGVKIEWCLLPLATIILSNQLVVDIVIELINITKKMQKQNVKEILE